MDIKIRDYEEKDFLEILAIFNSFGSDSFSTYHDGKVSLEQFKKILEAMRFMIVLEANGKVVGYGYVSRFKDYTNFDHTGILTYFILPEYTGNGLGTLLLNKLIDKGKEIGITNYTAHISSKNTQSLNFHRKNRFEEVGRIKNVAHKAGELIDIVWVQKELPENEVYL